MNKVDRCLECVLLLVLLIIPSSLVVKGIPTGWQAILFKGMLIEVIDGDTCDVYLDSNRKISGKKERIRLFYVDTPELSNSHKGKKLYLW